MTSLLRSVTVAPFRLSGAEISEGALPKGAKKSPAVTALPSVLDLMSKILPNFEFASAAIATVLKHRTTRAKLKIFSNLFVFIVSLAFLFSVLPQ